MERYQLDDPHLDIVAAKRRYEKYHTVKFGMAPEAEWPRLFRELLEFDCMLVDRPTVGCVSKYPFAFEVIDPKPIRAKPIVYPKH